MTALAWIVLILLTFVGLLGSILPGVPGLPLLLVGAVIHKIILPSYLSWWGLGILTALCLFSLIAEVATTFYGAKKWGRASRAGLVGAGVGGFIGLFFGPLGWILGPVLGAMVGELSQYRTLEESVRSGVGAGLGFGASTVLRIALGAAALVALTADLLLG